MTLAAIVTIYPRCFIRMAKVISSDAMVVNESAFFETCISRETFLFRIVDVWRGPLNFKMSFHVNKF